MISNGHDSQIENLVVAMIEMDEVQIRKNTEHVDNQGWI